MTLSDELRAMLEKAQRYLASAEIVTGHGDYDSAVSRLYYAMFYCAEALLLARGHTFSSHKGVLSGFARRFVKPGLLPRDLHRWLSEAFEKRQVSDYEFITGITEATARDLHAKAQQFLDATEQWLRQQNLLIQEES